jgi:hypothetical protein
LTSKLTVLLSQDSPLRYEVSYSLSDDEPPRLIYRGLKQTVNFTLPAGLPSHNYSGEYSTGQNAFQPFDASAFLSRYQMSLYRHSQDAVP